MSRQLGLVVSEILNLHFGEIVQKVGDDLFTYGSKSIGMIVKTTGLRSPQIIESLRSLIKYDLVSFAPSYNEIIADYKLIPENVLLLIRYPRYLLQIKTKYGSLAELIVEELLQEATCTATALIINIAKKYKDDKEKNITIVSVKDTFISLATAGYIQQAPVAELKEGSEIPTLVPVATIVPDLDARVLTQIMTSGSEITDKVYWKVNFDRFHQDFRDELMIKAVTRRIDENAGELMRQLLRQMYLSSSGWDAESAPTAAADLRDTVQRLAADKPLLLLHFDQYLKVLEENGCNFVRRRGDAAGGQYVVRLQQAAAQLLLALLDQTVTERLGSHATRIFRVVRAMKYIEEGNIQKLAMLANKECKELTYKLIEEHFITVHPMRKPASAGGMAKAIYLHYVDIKEAAHAAEELCHRSLRNTISRAQHLRAGAARLLDKQRRVRAIVHGMRLRGEPQHNIDDVEETLTPPELATIQDVERQLKQLSTAELALDETLFILHWYFMYPPLK